MIDPPKRSAPASARPFHFAAALCLALLAAGCSGPGDGDITIRSLMPNGPDLTGHFTSAVYRYNNQNDISVLLIDGPVDNPTQAVTVRMSWLPRAGKTPLDPTATNVTIHYIIFTGKDHHDVGIYSGAGNLYPDDYPGVANLPAVIRQASLRLSDKSSDAFTDLLGPSTLQGRFTARRDDVAFETILHNLDALIAKRLGYPRLVYAPTRPDIFDPAPARHPSDAASR